MVRRLPVLLIVLVGISSLTGSVIAENDRSDTCVGADLVGGGTYAGTGFPTDHDHFRFTLPEGNYLAIRFVVRNLTPGGTFRIETQTGFGVFAGPNGGNASILLGRDNVQRIQTTGPVQQVVVSGGEVRFRLYSNQDRPICFSITATAAGRWIVAFTKYAPTPPRIVSVEEHRALATALERKNRTIWNLRQRIENITRGNVSISVTVKPGGDRRAFVSGGTALVRTTGRGVNASGLVIIYRNHTYPTNETGVAVVPLRGTGRQELSFVYGGSTESRSIRVWPQDPGGTTVTSRTATGSATDRAGESPLTGVPGPTSTRSPTAVPGFGIVATLAAILLLLWQQRA